jgi:two-component system cell cycle response regulator
MAPWPPLTDDSLMRKRMVADDQGATAVPADRRVKTRRKIRFNAVVVFGSDRLTANCAVRDLSDSGARLKFRRPSDIPAAFHLIWAAERAVLKVETIWRSEVEIGVRFLSRHHMQGRLSSELAAVCRAWEISRPDRRAGLSPRQAGDGS